MTLPRRFYKILSPWILKPCWHAMLTCHIESFLLQWRQGQREVILNTKDFKTRRVRGLFSTVNCIPWHYWTNPGTGRFSWMFDYNYFLFNLNSFSLVQVLNMAVNTHFSVLVLCVLFFLRKIQALQFCTLFCGQPVFDQFLYKKHNLKKFKPKKVNFFLHILFRYTFLIILAPIQTV